MSSSNKDDTQSEDNPKMNKTSKNEDNLKIEMIINKQEYDLAVWLRVS